MVLTTYVRSVENNLNQGILFLSMFDLRDIFSSPLVIVIGISLNPSHPCHRNQLHKHLGDTGHASLRSR